jgi:hypothetical protein
LRTGMLQSQITNPFKFGNLFNISMSIKSTDILSVNLSKNWLHLLLGKTNILCEFADIINNLKVDQFWPKLSWGWSKQASFVALRGVVSNF